MRLHTITFGCQMAFADSDELSREFSARGFDLSPELESADAVLVNTCTVREHAEHRALSLLGRLKGWKEERPERLLVVAGCAAERLKESLQKRFPYVDLVSGAKSIEEFPAALDEALRGRFDQPAGDARDFPAMPPLLGPDGGAYITIMRGCNYSCTYCIVPAVRGRELYRDPETILRETREKAAAGAREVMLLGQTVNSYRRDGLDFPGLLRRVDAVDGVETIRFMSPHPFYVNEAFADAMADCAKVSRRLHLPAQSGSDRLLKAMRRNYTRAEYLKKAAMLRARLPGLSLTTDLIVGFPGETQADFEDTLSFYEEAGFDGAFCFKYSAREGTPAAALADMPEAVKEERLSRLLERVLPRPKAPAGTPLRAGY